MEPITSWSKERVSDWLKGLDVPLQQYPFTEWQVTGLELLQLSSQDLERLGVHKIGHQELILEAVEKLCSLTYGMGGESLRCLTEKLRIVVHSLTMGIQVRWRVNPYDGQTATRLPASVLQVVLELITSAKGLFSLLNRYQFTQLSAYTTSRNIITHCKELGTTVHKDSTVYEKEKDIISICRQLEAVCDEILNCSPEALLSHTAQLESVDLVPASPGDHLGIEITSTGSSNHYITGTTAESPAEFCEKILAGDEVIQVNDQIVVGWSRKNLVKKLKENPSGVTLVLKKVPVSLISKETAQQPPSPQKEEEEEEEEEEEGNQKHSIFERVAASVRSLSFRAAVQGPVDIQPMGQEKSDLSSDRGLDGSLTYTLCPRGSQGDLSYLSSGEAEGLEGSRLSPGPNGKGSAPSRSPSPRVIELGRESISSISSCPEMGGHTEDKEQKKASTKGTRKVMSRRRVSCRELCRPECDGWLWKKRKESSVFMTQKWQRFWFVLKGPSLYWYTSQQEEKAEGLVKISSYNIEGAGEHKRKYVFQMCHQRFQTFFFAAENVNDMTKWINCLISAIQKHKKFHKGPPDSEEDCYSETESEDEGSSPSPHRNKIYTKTLSNTLPRARKGKDKDKGKDKEKKDKMHVPGPPTGRSRSPGAPEDEMGVLFHRLNEGGVSLIGSDKLTTHDHFRKSFIRRNKNPVINEKAHTLRVLQSTLKDKEAELQLINKVLEDSDLTSQKYRHWKEHNEDLHLVIEKLAVQRAKAVATARVGHKEDQDTPPEPSPGKQVAVETGGCVCGLSLSDGEMLVDAEPLLSGPVKNVGDLDVEPQSEQSSTAESSTDQQSSNTADIASQASPDNYFYI